MKIHVYIKNLVILFVVLAGGLKAQTSCDAPYSVSVSQLMGTTALLTWTSEVEATNYVIEYDLAANETWTNSISVTDKFLLLSELQPQTSYKLRMKTVCSVGESDWVNANEFTTDCQVLNNVFITDNGTGTSNGNILPTAFYYKYSYTQQIITANELGNSTKNISRISVQYFQSTASDRNITIYMGHTSKNSFSSSSDYVAIDDLTQVFDGTISFNNNGNDYWFDILLNTTFSYNGTDNLVIAFDDNSGSYTNNNNKFYTHNTTDNKSIYYYTDSSNILPSSPSGTNNVVSCRNNFKLSLCDNDGCPQPNLYVYDIDALQAKIAWVSGESGASCVVEYANEGSQIYTAITAASPFTLTGLTQNTEYTVRIKNICDRSTESEWSVYNFRTSVINSERLYVTTSGAGNMTGLSWSNACNNLGRALETASLIADQFGIYPEIWVAAGTYTGDGVSTNNAFLIQPGVNVYGGFAGNEDASYDLSLRDFSTNTTILDGQNAQRVLYQSVDYTESTSAIWDGFTIQNGLITNGSGAGACIKNTAPLITVL